MDLVGMVGIVHTIGDILIGDGTEAAIGTDIIMATGMDTGMAFMQAPVTITTTAMIIMEIHSTTVHATKSAPH